MAAAILHVAAALVIFGVGRIQIFPQQFDHNGIGHFASDGQKFRVQTDVLTDTLLREGPMAWLKLRSEFHVRLYSLGLVLFRPLFGSTVLAFEPLNLFYYLAILTLSFYLTQKIAGPRAALLASAIVAVWPSILLHTTQPLRDPLFIATLLLLLLIMMNLLTRIYGWGKAMAAGALGVATQLVLWIVRPDMWQGLRLIAFLGVGVGVIHMWRERKLLPANLAALAMLGILVTVTFNVHFIDSFWQTSDEVAAPVQRSLPARIAYLRHRFILDGRGQSGSNIDEEVEFWGLGDEIKYLPRATEIGFLAPFPTMWFAPGYNVGRAGRILSGVETSGTYLIELLACVFLWRNRRALRVWFLALVVVIGIVPLGMVVVNVGTLYRMRYAFWILLVAMGSAGLISILAGRRKTEASVSLEDTLLKPVFEQSG